MVEGGMMAPLHTGTIAGKPVRFYRSPLDGPDFAWVALADLFTVCGFPPEGVRHWTAQWQVHNPRYARDLDGLLIAPGFAGKGLFEWANAQGWEPALQLRAEFVNIEAELFAVLYGTGDEAAFDVALQKAMLNDMFEEGAHVH